MNERKMLVGFSMRVASMEAEGWVSKEEAFDVKITLGDANSKRAFTVPSTLLDKNGWPQVNDKVTLWIELDKEEEDDA